ncbi:ABC transporter permease [Fimbriimonas ginsengisoli]|uniref:Antimicrobial peptide ABC transporter permease n=1 Tax=Fimbriimonas ginsengisoli Gsoil 348 TaxID=661478 RepID=A0A068NWT6_FIMGI|nr:FtsX-like permease family protein [Fimbriimonas ginsengisoli]AIE87837.1 antimicrobial peptide ABC transporter permease [Fimbriimonas ginsengisoli Gsoil 348]
MNQTEFKNVDPPFWVAWNQARASIRVRFFRQMITSAGIALGIAFFCSMQTIRVAGTNNVQSEAQLRWLVGTSLVMCLVGVTNSMLMSVTERFREIGTIKCLGASDGFIVKVFFLEALILGILGSLLGSLLGTGIMAVVQSAQGGHVPLTSGTGVVLLGTAIGTAMTVLAAIAPAMQAARMPAAAALRVEV